MLLKTSLAAAAVVALTSTAFAFGCGSECKYLTPKERWHFEHDPVAYVVCEGKLTLGEDGEGRPIFYVKTDKNEVVCTRSLTERQLDRVFKVCEQNSYCRIEGWETTYHEWQKIKVVVGQYKERGE